MVNDTGGKIVLSNAEVERSIAELAEAILRETPRGKSLALVGIASGGVPLAERLKHIIEKSQKREVLLGTLDITFYRDDIALRDGHPVIRGTDIPFNLDDTYVVLIDDVLFSGRTTRAALDALVDFGRPAMIRLAVLIDRGHRELPIQADFVGRKIATDISDEVVVSWQHLGAQSDEVRVLRPKPGKKVA